MTPVNKKIIHTVIEQTAHRFPNRIAVRHGARDITYKALWDAADNTAQRLSELGVGRDVIVGLAFHNSIAFITGMLAVMKAGGVFLPIDPAYPAKRIALILAKTPPQVVLCDQDKAADWLAQVHAADEQHPPYRVVTIDAQGNLSSAADPGGKAPPLVPAANRDLPEPDDPLYLFYTSGSTGEPKAILGCQKSISHFVHWEAREFAFDEHLRMSQLAPVAFDACLKDILVPLITGGRVCIPESHVRHNIPRLIDWAAENKITVIQCVPSLFRTLLKECASRPHPESLLPALKQVILAGEPIYGKDVNRFFDLFGGRVELVNFYGPTETTVIKTFNRIRRKMEQPAAMAHVGQPITNTAILITKGSRLCEIGEIGDIHIKTPFMTLGYYHDPEQTKAHFIQNPLHTDFDDLVYKTGDLGRYLPDRSIEFVGRLDFQVKVNGVRIHLAEIEKCLCAHPQIETAVAAAVKNNRDETILACYYKPLPATPADTQLDLRAYLESLLPPYMIPAAYIQLSEFPLSLNGKIDRKALPRPETLWNRQPAPSDRPETATENRLRMIWQDILNLKHVDRQSLFFEIGGHSLKAIQVVSRIYKEMQVEITLKDFFENATLQKLAALIDRQQPTSYLKITPAPDQPHYDLSHAQRRLWILSQMDQQGTAYSMPGAYLFQGPLDHRLIERAFRDLIVRHESLRTTFQMVNGVPKQMIHATLPGGPFTLSQTHVTVDGLPDKISAAAELPDSITRGIETRVAPFIDEEVRRPFDLVQGPLVRMHLLTLAADCHLILFNMHHIIGDGWSVDQLARELFTRYNGYQNQTNAPLPPLAIQYKDYSEWQQGFLRSEAATPHKAYWHDKLAGRVPLLDLPTDFQRPSVQSYKGQTINFPWDNRLTPGLLKFCRNHDASLFMALLAGIKVVCYHYTGQTDLVIGTPVAGRSHPDLEDQVGFYVNTLALRNRIDPEQDFTRFLSGVRETTLNAYQHQAYPFDCLVDELDLPRNVTRAPLFDIMLVFQTEEDTPTAENLSYTEIDVETHTSRFDLTFIFNLKNDRLSLKLNYNTDLWHQDTLLRMAGHLQQIFRQVLSQPASPVRDIDIMEPDERTRLFQAFTGPLRDFPSHESLITRFEEQACRTPGHTALIHENRITTYRELQDRSNQIADCLINTWDVQPGDIVGLMMARSDRSVLLLLAILKAGAVYLPLDASYPMPRLRYMLENSNCRKLIVDRQNKTEALPVGISLVYEDALTDGLPPAPGQTPPAPRPTNGDSPAWVLYTSGSTGNPKGILLCHRGYVNMVYGLIERFALTDVDRVLQFTPYSFDVSLSEIFSALLSGAALVIADRQRIDAPHLFMDYLEQHQVSVAAMPPTYLNALDRQRLRRLRVLITGGEPPNRQAAQDYSRHLDYFNAYGPSETSAYASVHRLSPDSDYPLGIPIGKPLPNTQMYILSTDLQPVPIGVTGEICISGQGLAEGYLNDPAKTAQAFIANPFAAGERLYRTGDLGKMLPDGEILFLGRRDEQIKIRGFRVEPGEIESALVRHPSINQAVVVKNSAADSLSAFFTADQNTDPSTLRSYLRSHLPDYMIPSHFIRLEALPLTPTGKIDKKALPSPDTAATSPDSTVPPRNDLEAGLIAIFQEIIGRTPISVFDNFFDLGGTSLHAIKVAALAFEHLGINLSAKDLFRSPTAADLAHRLSVRMSKDEASSPPTDTAHPSENPSPAVVIERHPLKTHFENGQMPPVDTVALEYLDDGLLLNSGMDKHQLLTSWLQNRPVLTAVTDTFMGRIGFITLPCFGSDLFLGGNGLLDHIHTALNTAQTIGAQCVSLTGLLPAATDQGQKLSTGNGNGLPPVTTGQATIAATLLINIENILSLTQRPLSQEHLAMIGTGPLGLMTLKLLLTAMPHPASIQLCSFYEEMDTLQSIADNLRTKYGYTGTLNLLKAERQVPETIYQATLMIGTAQIPAILNIDHIRPGTLIIDDPGNFSLSKEKTISRLNRQKDLLIAEGDRLACPRPSTKQIFLPDHIESALSADHLKTYITPDPTAITGCVLSGLLPHRCSPLKPTRGPINLEDCQNHVNHLKALKLKAAPLHYAGHNIDKTVLDHFVTRYSGIERSGIKN